MTLANRHLSRGDHCRSWPCLHFTWPCPLCEFAFFRDWYICLLFVKFSIFDQCLLLVDLAWPVQSRRYKYVGENAHHLVEHRACTNESVRLSKLELCLVCSFRFLCSIDMLYSRPIITIRPTEPVIQFTFQIVIKVLISIKSQIEWQLCFCTYTHKHTSDGHCQN